MTLESNLMEIRPLVEDKHKLTIDKLIHAFYGYDEIIRQCRIAVIRGDDGETILTFIDNSIEELDAYTKNNENFPIANEETKTARKEEKKE